MNSHRLVVRTLSAAVLVACATAVFGCRDSGGGDLVVITGGGGGGTTTPTPTPGSFTLVHSDPGGGTVLESADGTQRRIAGTFHQDYSMDASYEWILDAPVFIGDDTATLTPTLTIAAGTTIKGRGGTPPSMLVIRRAAQIQAVGTSANPIVFTSVQPVGSRSPGDWGGLVINGQAPVNNLGSGGELPFGEGGSGRYGGSIPTDNSGTLQYVRVEYGGHVFTSDDELNGIAFQGVGSGTSVSHVQVHRNADDGVEFFGGTVNVKYVYVTGCLDDSMDWTSGWTGKAQFVLIQQYDGGADNGIEADSLEADPNATPRSHPVISNMTMVGPANSGAASATGLKLRRGTGANIFNSIVMGFNLNGLDIDTNATWDNAYSDSPGSYNTLSGELTIQNTFFFDNNTNFADEGGEPQVDSVFNTHQSPANLLADPQLTDPQNQTAPNFQPTAGSGALGSWTDPSDSFFTTSTFIGAMDNGSDWTTGWTTTSQN